MVVDTKSIVIWILVYHDDVYSVYIWVVLKSKDGSNVADKVADVLRGNRGT